MKITVWGQFVISGNSMRCCYLLYVYVGMLKAFVNYKKILSRLQGATNKNYTRNEKFRC